MQEAICAVNQASTPLLWPDVLPIVRLDDNQETTLTLGGFSFVSDKAYSINREEKGTLFAQNDRSRTRVTAPCGGRPAAYTFRAVGPASIHIAEYQPTILASLPAICAGLKPLCIPLQASSAVNPPQGSMWRVRQVGGALPVSGYQIVFDVGDTTFGYDWALALQTTDPEQFGPIGPTIFNNNTSLGRASGNFQGKVYVDIRGDLTALTPGLKYRAEFAIYANLFDVGGGIVGYNMRWQMDFIATGATQALNIRVTIPNAWGPVSVSLSNWGGNAFTSTEYYYFGNYQQHCPQDVYPVDTAQFARAHCLQYPAMFNRYGQLISHGAGGPGNEHVSSHAHDVLLGCVLPPSCPPPVAKCD